MKPSSKSISAWFFLVFFLASAQHLYAQSSVLATGNWYKVAVTADGIYKLTYSDLQNLGINVSSIDPRHLSLYGNGGGLLPEMNSMPRPLDLAENAIEVVGENDGSFDPGDYILFYGQSQHRWHLDPVSHRFIHVKNIYSDTTCYFITIGPGNGKRIQAEPSLTQSANQTVTEFDDYAFYELDSVNLLHSGKEWYGEQLDNTNTLWSRDFIFPFHAPLPASTARVSFIGRSIGTTNTLNYSVQSYSDSMVIPGTAIGLSYDYAKAGIDTLQFIAASDTVSLKLNFSSADPSAMGWLNYVELNVRRELQRVSSQLVFRDRISTGPGNVADYLISNSTANDFVWDITVPDNVRQVQTTFSAGTVQMRLAADTLKEFIASDNLIFLSPDLLGQVPNQNLHAIGPVNLLIITYPGFLSAAQSFENMHTSQDGLTAATVTTDQVYNEYSSGGQDVTAIRDFIRSVYLKSTSADSLRYVMLMGDGSYDFKNRIAGNTNFVPGYQSSTSLNLTTSFVTDDFFVMMDSLEGDLSFGNLNNADIGIGRLPVKTSTEANDVFNKIYSYRNSSLGDWRKVLTFVADDEDQNVHFSQSESLNRRIDSLYCEYNIQKIYLDAYLENDTFETYPDVNVAIQSRADSGALLVNYNGHSNQFSWAAENVLDTAMISQFNSGAKLPFYYSSGEYFNRFDDPAFVSGGESLLLNPAGGAVASLSESRLSYSGSGFSMMQNFFNNLFLPVNGAMPRLGDIMKNTRQQYTDFYTYNYILLGDPALRLAYPENNVVTTMVNGNAPGNPDTLLAGSTVTIAGEIRDASGLLLSSFTGLMNVIVFDSQDTAFTLGNDPQSWSSPFRVWSDTLYSGVVSVTNGTFSFSFLMPMNVDFALAHGKISYYSQNGTTDASGCYDNFVVGGGSLTGIEEHANHFSISVYPNPATDECHFRITGSSQQSFVFSLYDISGRLVMEANDVTSDFTINLGNVNVGLYIYQIESADKKNYKRGKLSVE